jgi:hypothetical protein
MPQPSIENIEGRRHEVGIDDVELRDAIGRLAVGDVVQLTLITGPKTRQSVFVEIDSIHRGVFRGKLARSLNSRALARRLQSEIAFTTAHIHSIPRDRAPE